MTIGERIKELRKKKGLTQKDLAERVGFSYVNISQLENSRKNPKLETIRKIAAALDVSMNELLDENWDTFTPQEYAADFLAEAVSTVMTAANTLEKSMEDHLLQSYSKLNNKGKQEAIKRVDELTQLELYTKSKISARWKGHGLPDGSLENEAPITLHDVKAESEVPKGFQAVPTPQVDTFAAHVDADQPQPTKEQIDAAEALADELRRKASTHKKS